MSKILWYTNIFKISSRCYRNALVNHLKKFLLQERWYYSKSKRCRSLKWPRVYNKNIITYIMTYHFYKTLRRRYNIIEIMNASRILYGYTFKYLFFNDTIIVVKFVWVNFRYYKTYNKPNAVILVLLLGIGKTYPCVCVCFRLWLIYVNCSKIVIIYYSVWSNGRVAIWKKISDIISVPN